MQINAMHVCNVCLRTSEESNGAVFIQAVKNGEEIHVCTSCILHIIHGSGDIVKSNAQVEAELQN